MPFKITAATGPDFVDHSEIQASLAHRISNVGMSMTGLEQKGVIKKIDRGSYRFEDPVFERWLEANH